MKNNPSVEWAEVRVLDANGRPDVIVGHGTVMGRLHLARVSGRDGRILWDVAVADGTRLHGESLRFFDDLDGDGGTDALLLLPGTISVPRTDRELLAVSLRDGKRLWSQTLEFEFSSAGEIHVGDVDGDKRPDVVALEGFSGGAR